MASKRREVELARDRVPEAELARRLAGAPPPRDFRAVLDVPGPAAGSPPAGERRHHQVQVIAEVKQASPSAGVLRADFDPVAVARTYDRHGAACLSVLTDEPFFQGSLAHLAAVRAAVARPLLRKDFLFDRYQLLEARSAGADCVLLIAEVLDDATLRRLLRQARELGMRALVELHDAANLNRVIDSGAELIGINNRDLTTEKFVTRLEHTLELARRVPPDRLLVSESGIRNRDDVLRLQAVGVRAVLVGETLMRAADIGAQLDQLRGVLCR